MAQWQRRARRIVAIFAVAFAIAVVFAFRRHTPPPSAISRIDPNSVIESTGGHVVRVKGTREDVAIDFEKQVTYANGSSILMNVKVTTTDRTDGRVFTITGKQGRATDNPVTYAIDQDVRLVATDGMTANTEHATYTDSDSTVRAPGPATLGKGRIAATGIGLAYDTSRDVLTILDKAVVDIAPDEKGAGAVHVTSGTARFARREKSIRFEHDVKVVRGAQITEADTAVAFLSADEKRIEAVELHGGARIDEPGAAAGALRSLSGRDMNLKYAGDGQTLEHAVITDGAVIQVAGEAGQAGRQIAANSIDIGLAPDGSTPTALTAHERVRLTFPAEQGSGERTIRSNELTAKGEPGSGLRSARFTGNVDYREKGATVDRVARSAALDVALGPGLSAIEDATFIGGVRFDQGAMSAQAASAHYLLGRGTLNLTGTEPPPGVATPHVADDRISVNAARIDVTLDGPKLTAATSVKSVLQPPKKGAQKSETKLPSMLKQDQPVNVIADALDYDGTISRASYKGKAQLWQGDTSIRAETIVIDDKTGDLTAAGSVATSVVLEQVNSRTKAKEHVRSLGTAKDFKYEDAVHRATYTDEAHLSGPEGDVTAPRIELYLKTEGNQLDRAEAYDDVTLRESGRKTTGDRMTYFADDERYEMTGTPVKVIDECDRETIGKALTFDKAADTIVLDGKKQFRTLSKGSSKCPGA